MFIGHYAVALGAKRIAPDVSLGVMFIACQLADLIWPNLVLLGIESFEVDPGNTVITPLNFTHYPYSHSLVGLAIWSIFLGSIYLLFKGNKFRSAFIIALMVISHWLLDVVTHRADMPLSFSENLLLGLGLWDLPAVVIPLELAIFGFGLWLYTRQTRARDKIGKYGFWSMITFLVIVYLGNIFGPPPPSVMAVAWSAQALWIVVIWAWWVDKHRINTDR